MLLVNKRVSFRLPNDPKNESVDKKPIRGTSVERAQNFGLTRVTKGWKEDDCEVVIKSKEFNKDFF